jgi:hypothetical protein
LITNAHQFDCVLYAEDRISEAIAVLLASNLETEETEEVISEAKSLLKRVRKLKC